MSAGARAEAPRGGAGASIRGDALLFDLDGVLVDSRAAVERQWRGWASKVGLDAEALMQVVHGRRAADTIRDVAPWLDADREVRDVLGPGEASDTEGTVAIPGAVALLRALPAIRWAVVTSCVPQVAAARLRAAGLPRPRVLVTAADVRRGKPDPEGYLIAAARLGVAPERCIVFEDAPAGLEAARVARAHTVALTTTHPPHQLVAELIVQSFEELDATVAADGIVVRVKQRRV